MSFFSKSGVLTKIIQMRIELHSSIIDEMGVVVVVDGSLAELRWMEDVMFPVWRGVGSTATTSRSSVNIQVLCVAIIYAVFLWRVR